VHNGDPQQEAWDEDPIDFLRFIYDRYADRKPIQVSEFAATHYCRATNADTAEWATEKMRRFYETIAREFPRVKMVNWFSMDTVTAEIADNDYALTDNERILDTYRGLVASPHFLSRVVYDREAWRPVTPLPPLPEEKPTELPAYPRQPPRPARPVETPTPAPPLPYKAPPPQRVPWEASQDESLMAVLSTRAAIVGATSRVVLSGVEPGAVIQGTVELVAIVPSQWQVFYVAFELDGRIVALTNVIPYRVLLRTPLLPAGKHVIRALVIDRQRMEHESAALTFRVTAE